MSDRKFFITKSTRVAPIEGSTVVWRNFLNDATGGDVDFQRYLQQLCGYCLSGDTSEQSMFFICGPGGNGKSVFLNTIVNILGDYATTAPVDVFSASRNNSNSNALAMLRGARFVAASETESGMEWRESLIKLLTGGDQVTARYLYKSILPIPLSSSWLS